MAFKFVLGLSVLLVHTTSVFSASNPSGLGFQTNGIFKLPSFNGNQNLQQQQTEQEPNFNIFNPLPFFAKQSRNAGKMYGNTVRNQLIPSVKTYGKQVTGLATAPLSMVLTPFGLQKAPAGFANLGIDIFGNVMDNVAKGGELVGDIAGDVLDTKGGYVDYAQQQAQKLGNTVAQYADQYTSQLAAAAENAAETGAATAAAVGHAGTQAATDAAKKVAQLKGK